MITHAGPPIVSVSAMRPKARARRYPLATFFPLCAGRNRDIVEVALGVFCIQSDSPAAVWQGVIERRRDQEIVDEQLNGPGALRDSYAVPRSERKLRR